MTHTETYDVAKLGSLTNQIMAGVEKRFLQYGLSVVYALGRTKGYC